MSKVQPQQPDFDAVLALIEAARGRAAQAVNTTLIELYWQIGEHISRKLASAEWGDGVVTQLAAHIARARPGLRGFTRRNLFRMRQFYEAYRGEPLVSAALTQLPWTHHLSILSQSKRPEERVFYLRQAIREQWSSCELERQLKGALFERAMLSPPKVSPPVRHTHLTALEVFKDSYFASKDDEVVEYALSRSLSPALIAEYQTQLPDKKLLRAKLHELFAQGQREAGE